MHTTRINYIRHIRGSNKNLIDSIISSNAKTLGEYQTYIWLETKKAEDLIKKFEREYILKGNFGLSFDIPILSV